MRIEGTAAFDHSNAPHGNLNVAVSFVPDTPEEYAALQKMVLAGEPIFTAGRFVTLTAALMKPVENEPQLPEAADPSGEFSDAT